MASAHSLRKSSDKTMKLAADLQDEAAARIRELEAIVKRFPRTADGAPMRCDMWFLDDADVPRPFRFDDSRAWYSTREAAEAASDWKQKEVGRE